MRRSEVLVILAKNGFILGEGATPTQETLKRIHEEGIPRFVNKPDKHGWQIPKAAPMPPSSPNAQR